MLRDEQDLNLVRIICQKCGWSRDLTRAGCSEGKRTLVAIERSKDPSHVLRANVIVVPEERPLIEVLQEHPGYCDFVREAYEKGLHRLTAEIDHLLQGQTCPRCKKPGGFTLGRTLSLKQHARYFGTT
jgi:hypothetical protein